MKQLTRNIVLISIATLSVSMASAAGRDGGGGSPGKSYYAGKRDVHDAVKNTQLSFAFIFRELEDDFIRDQPLYRNKTNSLFSGLNKIFNNQGKNIYKLLQSNAIKINVLDQESCFNVLPSGKREPVYASAIAATNEICLSAKMMEESNQVQSEIQKRVTGLLVHEISHLFGTTEEEAYSIQSEVEYSGVGDARKLSDAVMKTRFSLEGVQSSYEDLLAKVNGTEMQLCLSIARFTQAITSMQEGLLDDVPGYAILGPQAHVKLVALKVKSTLMMNACGGGTGSTLVLNIADLAQLISREPSLGSEKLRKGQVSLYDLSEAYLDIIWGAKPGISEGGDNNISFCGTDCKYLKAEILRSYESIDDQLRAELLGFQAYIRIVEAAVKKLPKLDEFESISTSWGHHNP